MLLAKSFKRRFGHAILSYSTLDSKKRKMLLYSRENYLLVGYPSTIDLIMGHWILPTQLDSSVLGRHDFRFMTPSDLTWAKTVLMLRKLLKEAGDRNCPPPKGLRKKEEI